MRRMIGSAAALLAVGLLLLGSVATAEPRVAKDKKPDAAKEAKSAQAGQEKPADQPAEKSKSEAAGAKAKPSAKAKSAKKEKAKPAESKADEKTKPAEKEKEGEEAKPSLHTVKKELVKVEVSVKGVFEGKKTVPIAVSLDQWKTLVVKDGVEHGAKVRKGEVLIEFETEKLDQAIEDARTSVHMAQLSLKQAEKSLEATEETTPMDLTSTERAKKYADEDLKRYFDVDRPMEEKYAEFSLKSYQEMLENEEEELRQLEKMYKADDLTEETEEIVLKRQRAAVERAKFYLEMAKLRHEETLKIELPRIDESIRDQTRRQDISSGTAKVTIPLSLSRQRLDVDKMKIDLARNEKNLKELLADREKMTIRAPIDGVVYYGKYVRGSWSGGTSLADNMRTGGKVATDEVFMTVVQPWPLSARVTVPEGELHWFHSRLKGLLQPTAFPSLQLDCHVTHVDSVPISGGSFSAELSVGTDDEALMPGMACTAKFIPYLKERALTVPAKAVFTDDRDPRKKYVYLADEHNKPKKQTVEVGQKSGDNLEIVDGLSAGDKVFLERPGEDS